MREIWLIKFVTHSFILFFSGVLHLSYKLIIKLNDEVQNRTNLSSEEMFRQLAHRII